MCCGLEAFHEPVEAVHDYMTNLGDLLLWPSGSCELGQAFCGVNITVRLLASGKPLGGPFPCCHHHRFLETVRGHPHLGVSGECIKAIWVLCAKSRTNTTVCQLGAENEPSWLQIGVQTDAEREPCQDFRLVSTTKGTTNMLYPPSFWKVREGSALVRLNSPDS